MNHFVTTLEFVIDIDDPPRLYLHVDDGSIIDITTEMDWS